LECRYCFWKSSTLDIFCGKRSKKYNGNAYVANWGGQETPGSRSCTSESDCKNKGYQWVPKGTCVDITDPCKDVKLWDAEVAGGDKDPWEYVSSDKVERFGYLYRAVATGTQDPADADKKCTTKTSCLAGGWQWINMGKCPHSSFWVVQVDPCQGIPVWDQQIATGQKSPWDYPGGSKVQRNGYNYEAMWGGSQDPSDPNKRCDSRSSCSFNGWQWINLGKCPNSDYWNNHSQ